MFGKLANLFYKPNPARPRLLDLTTLARDRKTYLLASQTLSAPRLLKLHPPRIEYAKKQLLFDISLSRGLSGDASVLRYQEIPLPSTYQPYEEDTPIVARKGYFQYTTSDRTEDWFMNFAHHDLFHGYGLFMFAQDEIQVAEHPVLASFREMMLAGAAGLRPMTVEGGVPTPVLFRRLQRTVAIDTRSIYGARFARADEGAIRKSVRPIEPPTLSNILAIEAPISSGNKVYDRAEVEGALRTAFSGFRAAVLSSVDAVKAGKPIVLHTGNWGCGAYGGNRQLMLSIQMMAARLAGIAELVIYGGADSNDDVGVFDAELSRRFKFKPGVAVSRVVDRLVAAGFQWGTPDGN